MIISKYSEPWRHYNNLAHVEELLALSERHRASIKDIFFVNLSIIFHDIVYFVDARSSENEKLSAEFFQETLGRLVYDKSLVGRIRETIEQTKTHSVAVDSDTDLKLCMDFDMAILGAPRPKYAEYAQNIRREFAAINEEIYCKARSDFFKNYLATTSNIYASDLFRATHEEQARANIAWECTILERGRLVSAGDI